MTAAPGDKVTIRKGVTIRSTHPTRSRWEARRTYSVEIHHMLSAVRIAVGYLGFDAEGNVVHESIDDAPREARYWLIEAYGTDDLEKLREHMVESTRYDRPNGTSYCSLMLEVAPPKIVWAGRGGYWCEIPVGEVQESEDDG